MDFGFSTEQEALRDAAREVFEKESPPSRLRELWDAPVRERTVWKTLASVGLTGVTVAEQHGGMGGDERDLVLVLEEAGRAALPEPLLETVAVAAPLLASSPAADEWLPRIAVGEAIVSLALDPYALDADDADLLIAARDGALVAVPRGGFTARRVRSEDGARRLFAVNVTGDGVALAASPEDAFVRAAAATAAMLNGVSMRLLETTIAYVRQREQFGKVVGSFQAVKHKLASAHVLVEQARAAAWYAAYALATRASDAPQAASVAKVTAAEAGALANTEALQCHGGIGFTWEHDLHLWLKRGKAHEAAYGTAAEHRARLADAAFADA